MRPAHPVCSQYAQAGCGLCSAGAIFHCMHKEWSAFLFQRAEGQRHAALVAQGEPGPQPVLRHPCGGLPAETVSRGTVLLPEGGGHSAAQGRPPKVPAPPARPGRTPGAQRPLRGQRKGFFPDGKGCTGRSRCRKAYKGSFRGQNAARTSFILPEHCWKFCAGCANPA